jgi:hypothetical protein
MIKFLASARSDIDRRDFHDRGQPLRTDELPHVIATKPRETRSASFSSSGRTRALPGSGETSFASRACPWLTEIIHRVRAFCRPTAVALLIEAPSYGRNDLSNCGPKTPPAFGGGRLGGFVTLILVLVTLTVTINSLQARTA